MLSLFGFGRKRRKSSRKPSRKLLAIANRYGVKSKMGFGSKRRYVSAAKLKKACMKKVKALMRKQGFGMKMPSKTAIVAKLKKHRMALAAAGVGMVAAAAIAYHCTHRAAGEGCSKMIKQHGSAAVAKVKSIFGKSAFGKGHRRKSVAFGRKRRVGRPRKHHRKPAFGRKRRVGRPRKHRSRYGTAVAFGRKRRVGRPRRHRRKPAFGRKRRVGRPRKHRRSRYGTAVAFGRKRRVGRPRKHRRSRYGTAVAFGRKRRVGRPRRHRRSRYGTAVAFGRKRRVGRPRKHRRSRFGATCGARVPMGFGKRVSIDTSLPMGSEFGRRHRKTSKAAAMKAFRKFYKRSNRMNFGDGGNPPLYQSMGMEFCRNGGGVVGPMSTGLFPTACTSEAPPAMAGAAAFGRRRRYRR